MESLAKDARKNSRKTIDEFIRDYHDNVISTASIVSILNKDRIEFSYENFRIMNSIGLSDKENALLNPTAKQNLYEQQAKQ